MKPAAGQLITFRINYSPEPERSPGNRNGDLIHIQLIIRSWPVFANTMSKMAAKAIDPGADSFPADDHGMLSQQILHIGRTEHKPVIGPYCIRDNLTRNAPPSTREKNSVISRHIDTGNSKLISLGPPRLTIHPLSYTNEKGGLQAAFQIHITSIISRLPSGWRYRLPLWC